MVKITYLAFLVFFITFPVNAEKVTRYSENYENCITSAGGEHPAMINCLEREKIFHEEEIRNMLDFVTSDDLQENVLSEIKKTQPVWVKYFVEQCSIYLQLGGQRGELLQKNCETQAVIERSKFIRELLDASEI